MYPSQQKNLPWIGGPVTDLFFFSFGWVLVFLAFVLLRETGNRNPGWGIIVTAVLMVNILHRHATFPLVYADPEQFQMRKGAYIGLPLFFLALTTFSVLYGKPLFSILLVASVFWTMYHTLAQKVGMLRIYSRRGGYGKAWLDKAVVYSWFFVLFFHLGSMPEIRNRITRLAVAGKVLARMLEPIATILPFLVVVSFVIALGITFLYLREEWAHRRPFSWPKNLFLLSLLMIYSSFYYDFFAGYVIFGFSHALEYLAFVSLFTRRKYLHRSPESSPLAKIARRQALWLGIFCLALLALFLPWRLISYYTLTWYIVGSSFLHFIYDGWIWKIRDQKVGQPLGIPYPAQLNPEMA